MELSKSKKLLPLLMLVLASMLVSPLSFASENPWDGDDPAGGSNSPGGNGDTGGGNVTPEIRSTIPDPPVPGFNIEMYVEEKLYHFVSRVTTLFTSNKQMSSSATTTVVPTTGDSKRSVSVGKPRQ